MEVSSDVTDGDSGVQTTMHHANHFYGHAHVLAAYCGLDQEHPPRMSGYLQHGWNIGDGLAPGTPYAEGSSIFLWSEQSRRRSWSLGRRSTVVVGAPWIYLDALVRGDQAADDGAADEGRDGTIWYPFHGWEGQTVFGDHQRLIDMIRAVETGPVTVCLYYNEYGTPVRKIYEHAGFRVICHGYRGHWWRNTDTEFLRKQMAELRRHKRVASNRLSSAIFYGAYVGCDIAVYGDPMVLENEDMTYGGQARIRRQWPEMHGAETDRAVAAEIARAELGGEFICSPTELKQILGWYGDESGGVRESGAVRESAGLLQPGAPA
jgi:hypothetical protein